MRAYRGLGAWVDLYDFGHKESMEPGAIVEELANRGVRTLFLQTSRWTIRNDIANPGGTDAFLELAHARGIQVVGWYLPGFADLDRDVRASLAVLEYASPTGHRFDGFAVDIEDARAVGNHLGRFNQGIAEYSVRLRQAVPPGTVLGAIVPDAKNNERAPGRWAGFPWPEIAANFDVILPMAYWSVTKPASCPAHDAVGYMREVAEKTTALMGAQKPLHLIGGIADCIRSGEVAGYVDVVRDVGSIGGSLYDFLTTHTNPERDAFWEQLGRLNG